MGDHFSLDIHPHQLRVAARSLDTIRESLTKHAKTATNEPDTIGTKWTGSTADSVTGEMTAVGAHLSTFVTHLLHCSTALTTLAGHYEKAQTTLADLNTKWAKSESTYTSACNDADTSYHKTLDKLRDSNGGKPVNGGLTMDLDDARSTAKSNAYAARQSTQSTLESDFTTLKQHLTTQTSTCGTALSTNIPVKNLGMCTADNPSGLDHANLLTDLTLVAAYEQLDQEAEDKQKAVDAAAPEIKALQDALDDVYNPDEVEAALKAIQKHVDGPYGAAYAQAMLAALGDDGASQAKAVNEIYKNLDWAVRRNDVDPYEQKDEILAFTHGLEQGLAQSSDADYGKFYGALAGLDQGAEQLALIASGSHDARQTSAALALQSRWYHYPSGSRELFPEIFQYAYDPPEDMVKILNDRSDGAHLAKVLEKVTDSKQLDFILQSLTLTTDGGGQHMSDADANIQFGLLTSTIEALKNRFITTSDSDGRPSTALVHALDVARNGHWGSDDFSQTQELDDKMRAELTSILNDPDFVRSYLDQTHVGGDYPKTLIAHLIDATDLDTSTMIKNLIEAEVKANEEPDQIARLIGDLMRDEDLGTMEVDWSKAGMAGVKEAVSDALSELAKKNPVTGAVYGPLKAIIDDLGEQQEKIDEAYKGWDDAQKKDVVQNEVAVALYIKAHGVPDSFTDWMSRPDMKGQPDAISRYFQDIMRHGSDVKGEDELADELAHYADLINASRDNT